MAISILSLGATASVRVISESSYIARQIQQRDLAQQAQEELAFKIFMGDFPELFQPKGGAASGSVPVTSSLSYLYEIQSSPLPQSRIDYEVNATLRESEGREISSVNYTVRPGGK